MSPSLVQDLSIQGRFFAVSNYLSYMGEAVVITSLVLLTFQLKHIPQEFNIMNELFTICWLRAVLVLVRYYMVFYHFESTFVRAGYMVYVSAALDMLCILATSFWTLLLSYSPN